MITHTWLAHSTGLNSQQALNKCFSNESLVNKNYKEYYVQLILNAKNHPFSELFQPSGCSWPKNEVWIQSRGIKSQPCHLLGEWPWALTSTRKIMGLLQSVVMSIQGNQAQAAQRLRSLARSKRPVWYISIAPSSGLGTRKVEKRNQEAPGEWGWMRKWTEWGLGLKSRKGSGQEAAWGGGCHLLWTTRAAEIEGTGWIFLACQWSWEHCGIFQS